MAAEWRSEAENSKLEDSPNKIALLLLHLTDLLATCITQQAEILALDNSVAHLQDRLQRVEQRPVAAADAGSSNTADRLTALEMRVGSLQDGAQLQQTAWLDNLLSKYGVVAADLHTMISWDDLKAAWHKRFQVEPLEIKAMNKLMVFEQGSLPSMDWIAEYQRLTSVPDIQMCFKVIRHYFISRSCPTLSNALTHVEDTLTTTAELFDKAAQIIVTNKEAKNLRSSASGPSGYQHRPRVVMVAAAAPLDQSSEVASASKGDRFAAAREGGRPARGRGRGKPKTHIVSSLGPGAAAQTGPWTPRTLEDYLGHLRRVFETLGRAKYKANRDKCEFVRQEQYLGHFVTPEGISPLSDKIQAVQEWSEPRNITDVLSFLGLTGYYQRFIKGYSKITAHLNKLQCEGRPFDFGEEARGSFLALKATLLSAEILRIYDPLAPTRVTTDASGYDIGAVLEQHDGVDWHPVEYFSKKVSLVHSIHDARKKELLAFVHALKRWRHFLLGRCQFRWVTDNNPLVFYKTQDTVNNTIARWMAFIDQFDFFPDHILGKSNRFADALSRRPDHCTAVYSTFEIDDDVRNSFIRGYQADPDFRDKYTNCSSPNPAPSHYWIQEGYLLVNTRGKDLLCVPSDPHLRTRLLGEFHDAPATKHFGVNRTIGRLCQRFWWPGLLGDVTHYCESCEVCRRCKSCNHRPYGELRPLPVPLRRREAIAMDITGPFPKHKTGVNGILTVVDRLTKFAMFLPYRYHAKAPELVEVLYVGWIRTKGYPKEIVCDRDTQFMSDFWLALIKRWGSSLKPSSVRQPQTDGQTERAHQTAQVLLRTLIRPDQKDWVERLPDVDLAYNSSIHLAIGLSPFEFEHGSPVTSPLDTITPPTAESDDHLFFLRRMQELLVKARDQMAKTQQRMSQQANRQRLPCPFRAGDLVWV
ncbi:hypothetical protein CBR_g36244 [Chara braunii]|uniref:Integrase catalytic domain-containing protein n=1 Tax=Chara braunii TaxID=69332 RepID=A0A388LK68_CHABU|nr:hypothetical protein CBR_g36244 [Chara braunii]|eukprot:GBG82716.1 hypothetical protein CBR_g36244 [Chara braunii]